MKRVVFILATVFLGAFSAFGQVSIECQGGLNFANLSDPGNLIEGAVWSTHVGGVGEALVNIPLTDRLFLSSGLRYVQKGTESNWSSGMTGKVEATVRNSYLELPLHLKYAVLDVGPRLFILGGPSVGYLMNSRTEATVQLYGSTSSDTKEEYKSYDVTLDIGLELAIPVISSWSVVAAGSYSFGIVKVQNMESHAQTRDVGLTLGVQYAFN